MAGLGAYRAVLADPRARAFSTAGFVARMPLSMTGLGIVLLVSAATGSFGQAGLVTAVGTVAGAASAPWWGRLIDRVGQARVLTVAALINSSCLTLLILSVQLGLPLAVTALTAVGAGLGFSSAGSCVRARWTQRLASSPLLHTAYSWEAVIDEVVFIVGPPLVTFLATAWHPAAGLASCAVLGWVGAVALARMKDTQPPTGVEHHTHSTPSRLPILRLVPVVAASLALGGLFGAMEVVVVAFAKEAGILAYAGFILLAWAFGSLLAGLVTGTVSFRASPARRFRVASILLACSMLPLPFVEQPVLVAALLVLSGFAIAPTLIASVAVTQSLVPSGRLTEALGWASTGLALGLALGAASSGQIVDSFGAHGGFVGAVGMGALLIVASLFVRSGSAEFSPATPDTPPTVARRPAARNQPR